MTPRRPPRAAIGLLRRTVGVEDASEGIVGDLTEEFHALCEGRGVRAARRWFWRESIRIALAFGLRGRSVRRRELARGATTSGPLEELVHAARGLRRARAFSVLSVTILALGIGAATAIFSAVRAVIVEDLPVANPDEVVVLSLRGVGLVPHEIDELRAESRLLGTAAGTLEGTGAMPVTEGDRPLVLDFAFVTAGFFDVLGARPALGRLFRPEDDAEGAAPVTVISHATWRRAFGRAPDVVGRRLTATQYQGTYTIIGVAPPGLDYPLGVDYWILPGPRRQALSIVARLPAEAGPEAARSELEALARGLMLRRENPTEATRVTATRLEDAVLGDARPILGAIAAAALLLLLIACANVAHLLLMRATRRSRDVMVRRALGASFGRIARMFLLEGVLVGASGGVLGLACATFLLGSLGALVPADVPRHDVIGLAGPPLGMAIAVTLLAMLLVSGLPALAAAWGHAPSASAMLRGSMGTSAAGRRARDVRRSFVASQVALAVVVLFGAGLLARTLQRLDGLDLGYEADGVAVMELGIDRRGLEGADELATILDGVFARVRALPGVTAVSPLMARPFTGSGGMYEVTPVVEGDPEAGSERTLPRVPLESGGSELFRTLGIPILRGRGLLESDRRDAPRIAVVSASLAERLWPGQDPIGRRIGMSLPREEWWTVVGVAGDTRFRRLREITPTIYLSWRQFRILPVAWTVAVRTDGALASLVPTLDATIRRFDPRVYLWRAESLEEHLGRGPLAGPRASAALFSGFGLAALLLAAIGLYGVVALAVQERTRELGVRRALGARSRELRAEVLGEALRTTAVGALVGLAFAAVAARALAGQLFEVGPADPVTVAGVSAVLLTVSIVAAWLPVRRATRIDALVALRHD